jgi:hypothetical protein
MNYDYMKTGYDLPTKPLIDPFIFELVTPNADRNSTCAIFHENAQSACKIRITTLSYTMIYITVTAPHA